jgi:hypothetical protein
MWIWIWFGIWVGWFILLWWWILAPKPDPTVRFPTKDIVEWIPHHPNVSISGHRPEFSVFEVRTRIHGKNFVVRVMTGFFNYDVESMWNGEYVYSARLLRGISSSSWLPDVPKETKQVVVAEALKVVKAAKERRQRALSVTEVSS